MSLDADVAAVVDGSRPKVRGILRLPARPLPSYSAVAARQPAAFVPTTPSTTHPTTAQYTAASALSTQPWQTVPRRRHGKHEARTAPSTADDSVTVDAEAAGEVSGADGRRRRKKKAGEPPPASLHFVELLEAQLKRVEQKSRATETADSQQSDNRTQPSTALTASPLTPATASDSPSTVSARSVSQRAKPTRLKRQIRQQQLTAFIRQHILVPIVQAAVTQGRANATGTEAEENDAVVDSGAGTEDGESERIGRERRDKKRMLRHLKRKQKRIDKQANSQQPASSITQPHSQPTANHTPSRNEPNDGTEREDEGEENEYTDDSVVSAGVESVLPRSQPTDPDEDPSCPNQPYSFTAEERAFLFQHVVVDRYHSQPPLSPVVSGLCQQLFTPAVDSPVAHLLLALASYQRRALSSPSPLVRARGRRFVLGLREATKRLKQNKLLLLVLPHNVETAHPALAIQLTTLYFQCVARGVDVVWSLSRRRLASCCGVKGRAAVVGLVSGEGCSELMRAVRDRAREAREAWALRGWDERVEPGVRERRDREDAEREEARRQWQERELEARREEKKKEKARLAKEMEEARRRDELLQQRQAERRLEQQRQAAVRREADERREEERVAEEAEKLKRKQRQERMKAQKDDDKSGQQQQQQQQQAAGKAGKGGEGIGGKKTWLEEAAEGKDSGLGERSNGVAAGKQGKGKEVPEKLKKRR